MRSERPGASRCDSPRSIAPSSGPIIHIKRGLVAQERDRPHVRAARHLWITRRQAHMRAEPHRLAFLDETSVKTNPTRLRGRAPVGERLYGTAPFGKWCTQTFIAGLTSDELIVPWVIEGAVNQVAFDTYVETQLAPLPQ